MTNERMEHLFDKMLVHLAETTNNKGDLLDVLHGIGFTDEEIRENVELFWDYDDEEAVKA